MNKTISLLATALTLVATLHAPAAQAEPVMQAASPYGGSFGALADTYGGDRSGGAGCFQAASVSTRDRYSQSWAAGDLANGQLHAAASADRRPCTRVGCTTRTGSQAATAYWDTVTFSNGRNIGVANLRLDIDGTLSPQGARATLNWYLGPVRNDFWRDPMRWANQVALQSGDTDLGTDLLVPVTETTYFFFVQLIVDADALYSAGGGYDGAADFGNTVHFRWTLPEGVSFRSASGVFMSAAEPPAGGNVPEPTSVLLALTGLAALTLRRPRMLGRWS